MNVRTGLEAEARQLNAEEDRKADLTAPHWLVTPAFGADCKGEELPAISDDEVRP